MVKIAPSVLALDYALFNEQISEVNKYADWIHFDVMDGHFVPNLSFGPDILKTIVRHSKLYMDVHLMVSDPLFFAPIFIKAGASSITYHYESIDLVKQHNLIDLIHESNIKVGVSIKPNTSVEVLLPILEKVDIVLVMSVEPGFGGQSFLESAYEKVTLLKSIRKSNNYSYLIEVDGGVNNINAPELIKRGADVLVAGSYIFKGEIKERIASLKI